MSSDRLILEHRKPLSLSKAHKRLAAFIDLQIAAQPTLPGSGAAAGQSAVDDSSAGLQLRSVDRVKVHDHILFQLQRIREAMLEERQREKGSGHTGEQADGGAAVDRAQVEEADNVVQSSGSVSGGGRTERGKSKKSKKRKSTAHLDD